MSKVWSHFCSNFSMGYRPPAKFPGKSGGASDIARSGKLAVTEVLAMSDPPDIPPQIEGRKFRLKHRNSTFGEDPSIAADQSERNRFLWYTLPFSAPRWLYTAEHENGGRLKR